MFPREALPERIGPYKIVRHLSSRGGADLYLGEHVGPMGFQRTCVLKLVPAPGSDDPRSAQELAHEAKICSRLNHPAIVRMHDFFEHGDRLVLVFEHFAGVTLARLLAHMRRRRVDLPDGVTWYISHQLFSGLAHAHSLTDDQGQPTPVVHRDVQPAHIVISNDGQVRLTGFGIAKIAGTVGDTAVGFVKGTPAYMAPEQARGDKITERVDVYAAGLVMWEMLTGRSALPRDARPGAELLRMISGRRVEPVSALRPEIPREIGAAIDACLELSPEKRSIRCADVERWLKKVVDVNNGRDVLRERIVQMRNVAMREPAPAAAGARTSSAPRAAESVRVPPRFPGIATRATGRVSGANQGAAVTSPTRRVPGVKGSRSSVHAPPLDASAHEPTGSPPVRAGGLPRSKEMSEALRAPRMPSMDDASEAASSQAPRAKPSAAPAARPKSRTLLGVPPPAIAPGQQLPEPAPAASAPKPQAPATTPAPRPEVSAPVQRFDAPPPPAQRFEPPKPAAGQRPDGPPASGPVQRFDIPPPALGIATPIASPRDLPKPVAAAPAVPKVVVTPPASPRASTPEILGPGDVIPQIHSTPLLPGETTQVSKRRQANRALWIVGAVVGVVVLAGVAVATVSALLPDSGRSASSPSASLSAVSAAPARSGVVVEPIASAMPSSSAPLALAPSAPAPATSESPPAAVGSTSAITQEIQIPAGWGVVLAHAPPSGVVYVHGTRVGETDAPALAPCGRRYVRIGTRGPGPGLRGVAWLSAGQSVEIPCGKMVEIPATPDHPLKDNQKKRDNAKRVHMPKSAF